MEIRRTRPSGLIIQDLAERLEMGDGLGLRQNGAGLPQLLTGAWVEVRAEGLKVDGTTNETTELDQVMDYVADLGGGVVNHRHGTLLADQLKLRTNVLFIGNGMGSIVKQRPQAGTLVDSGTSSGGNTTTTLNDTSKAWGTPDAGSTRKYGYTLKITSGPLSGVTRRIGFHSATQLPLDRAFASVPGTVTYEIYAPTHLVVLNAVADEFCGLINCRLDGNKANQTLHCDLIHLVNTSGGPTLLDTHHLIQDVIGLNPKGNGLTIGANMREARFINLTIQGAGQYGKETMPFGGTDGFYIGCTFASCDLTGIIANGTGDHFVACKAFGNGQALISGNGAGAIISQPSYFSLLNVEENSFRGVHILNINSVTVDGLSANANGGAAVVLDNCFDCRVAGIVRSDSGMAYQTAWALHVLNGADRNDVALNVKSADLSGGLIEPTGAWSADNRVWINNRLYGRGISVGRTIAAAVSDEHWRFGKQGAPASGNAQFGWSTDSSNPPLAKLQSWDGTSAYSYLTLNPAIPKITVGDAGITVDMLASDVVAGTIRRDTPDAADNNQLFLAGGGAFADTRGGRIGLYGNEQGSTPGRVFLSAGNVGAGDIILETGGATRLTINNAGAVTIAQTLGVTGISTLAGDVIASVVRRGTAEGADNSVLYLAGGGSTAFTRGAFMQLWGNESPAGYKGRLDLIAGDPTDDGHIMLYTGAAVPRMQIAADGEVHFYKVIRMDGDALTGFISLRNGTTQHCALGRMRTLLGSGTDESLGLFVETGLGIAFMVNGSVTEVLRLTSGGVGVFAGAVTIDGNLIVDDRVESSYGSTSAQREHFRFGRDGSGSSGNPYYVLLSDASAIIVAKLCSFDGTTTRTYLRTDHNANRMYIGDNGSVGAVLYAAPGSAPADSNLEANSWMAWINEAGNALTFRVKYADGTTVKAGSIALA